MVLLLVLMMVLESVVAMVDGIDDSEQVQEMMGQADKDGTNSLDIIEFLQVP